MDNIKKVIQDFSECNEVWEWKCKNCFNLNKERKGTFGFDEESWHYSNDEKKYNKVAISNSCCRFCKVEQKIGIKK